MTDDFENKDLLLSQWLAGQITDEDIQKEFGDEALVFYKKLIESTDKLDFPKYDTDNEFAQLKQKLSRSPQTKALDFPIIYRWAVAAIIILGVSIIYYLTLPNYTVYQTGYGERLAIELPDGSDVELSANSELKYIASEYNTDKRDVKLKGQAFFEVEKGTTFSVETSTGKVRVLGTSFNVVQWLNQLDVTCYTGKVLVQNEAVKDTLAPGQNLRINEKNVLLAWNTDQKVPTWMSGVTEINESTLAIALEALKNVYGIKIESNLDLDKIPFDGAFPHDNIDIAINSVLGPENITYKYQSANQRLVIGE